MRMLLAIALVVIGSKPFAPVEPTVAAVRVGPLTWRISWMGVVNPDDPSLLGEHGGVQFIEFPSETARLVFEFSDSQLATLNAIGEANPDASATVTTCRGGFTALGECPDRAPILMPRLKCAEDRAITPNVFDYRLSVEGPHQQYTLPDRVDGIRVTWETP